MGILNQHINATKKFKANFFGMMMMLCHVLALSLLYAAVKMLVKDLSSNIIVFMYKLSILLFILPLCLFKGVESLKTKRLGLHFIRAFFSICGTLSMFYAIKYISLADMSAVQYLEHIMLLIIGILYFGEKATKTKVAIIIFSFIGALVVVRPDLFLYAIGEGDLVSSDEKGFNSYYVFVFMAITFWALNSAMVKVLGKTEKTNAQVLYTTLFSLLLSFPVAFMNWVPVTEIFGFELNMPENFITFADTKLEYKHILPIIILGSLYFTHSITHFHALKNADISLLVPLEYGRLVFAAILGYVIFGEVPNEVSYIGYALIVGAGLFLIYSERRRYTRSKKK